MTLKACFWTDFGLLGVGVRLDEHEGCVRLAARLDGLGAQTLARGLHDDVRHLKTKRTRLKMTQNGSKWLKMRLKLVISRLSRLVIDGTSSLKDLKRLETKAISRSSKSRGRGRSWQRGAGPPCSLGLPSQRPAECEWRRRGLPRHTSTGKV